MQLRFEYEQATVELPRLRVSEEGGKGGDREGGRKMSEWKNKKEGGRDGWTDSKGRKNK